MTRLPSWTARIGVCVALALPSLSSPANAEGTYRVAASQHQLLAGPMAQAGHLLPVSTQPDSASLRCLTEALYFEARGEPLAGQRAVAEVILNRVAHPAFPKSVCGVVNQGGQFSYKGRRISYKDRGALGRAQQVAEAALMGAPRTLTNGATYFHTTHLRPSWSGRFVRTARIGSHIFYRRGGAQRMASN